MIIWSPKSISDFDSFLARLRERSPTSARKARAAIDAAVQRLASRPQIGRRARWPGFQEWSLTRWRKIIVYRVVGTDIEIAAIYDARQDLTKSSPNS